MKFFNLTWVANDIRNIENYKIIAMNGDNNETIKATILHPNTTSTLMAIQDDVPNPRFLVETLDKINVNKDQSLTSVHQIHQVRLITWDYQTRNTLIIIIMAN